MGLGRRWAAVLLGLTLCAGTAACTGGDEEPVSGPTVTTSAKPAKPAKLTFGVFGTQDEVTAYQRVANSYNAVTDESDVTLTPYSSESDLVAGLREGTVPDVFLVSRGDLPFVQGEKLNRPLSGLLDERGVDFGDGYSRDALEAFSFDRDIQCMPYGISPDVVYYNKRWIDFDKMLARGLPAPTIDPEDTRTSPRWSFTGFEAAAQFGTRPRRGIAGVYVDPTLRGLAPFIYSGGGDVFDDDDNPTSLALSDGGSRDALGAVLPLLRNPELTLSADQLAQATPLQWFKRGKLAMIVGTRDLVPRLRGVEGLDFDVMPMPVVDDAATVGDVTGICLSSKAADTDEAADFLVHAISAESVGQVVQAGALAPANQAVALSDTFLQPDQLPVHSSVFVSSVRDMVIPPLLPQRQELSDLVAADVRLLFTTPVLDPDLEALTTRIDEESRTVLDPGSEEPSATPDD